MKQRRTANNYQVRVTDNRGIPRGRLQPLTLEETIGQLPNKLPPERWHLYWRVMTEARRRGIPFAVGGGVAATAYAGYWRDTKDIDLYVRPGDRYSLIALLQELGLADYYGQKPYDRAWIFRTYSEDTIIDVMWAMANQRARVDDAWLNGPVVNVSGEHIRIVPPEETLWSKLYVLQSDRCDWPDVFNILYAVGPKLNWRHLLDRVGDDVPLLGALLAGVRWLCPAIARQFPPWLWSAVGVAVPPSSDDCGGEQARLLDSRPWFAPLLSGSGGHPS
jgi:hypothetical protein